MAMQRLGLASLVASKPCRERDRVLAMVASRIIEPCPKLATTRWWHTTTLAEDFGVADASEDDRRLRLAPQCQGRRRKFQAAPAPGRGLGGAQK